MRIFLALQNQLFGPKITLIINFSVFTIKCADSNPMTPVAQISDFSLLSTRMFDQVRGYDVLQHVQIAFYKEY